LHQRVTALVDEVTARRAEPSSGVMHSPRQTIVPHLNHSSEDPVENLEFVHARWRKLQQEFYNAETKRFDISKIPDIYDCALYDMLHSAPLDLQNLPEVHELAHDLANFMVPLEYGITKAQKSSIGVAITGTLVKKLVGDLHKWADDGADVDPVLSNDMGEGNSKGGEDKHELYQLDRNAVNKADMKTSARRVHSRLYFTSESHIISLLNVIRWGHERKTAPVDPDAADGGGASSGASTSAPPKPLLSPEAAKTFDDIISDGMAFLTHLVLTLHESFDYAPDSIERFRVRILFSPGANTKEIAVTRAVPLTPPEGLPLSRVALFFRQLTALNKPIDTGATQNISPGKVAAPTDSEDDDEATAAVRRCCFSFRSGSRTTAASNS